MFDKTASSNYGLLISNHMCSEDTFDQSFVHSILFYGVHSPASRRQEKKHQIQDGFLQLLIGSIERP